MSLQGNCSHASTVSLHSEHMSFCVQNNCEYSFQLINKLIIEDRKKKHRDLFNNDFLIVRGVFKCVSFYLAD